jgi:hypothetical protein
VTDAARSMQKHLGRTPTAGLDATSLSDAVGQGCQQARRPS